MYGVFFLPSACDTAHPNAQQALLVRTHLSLSEGFQLFVDDYFERWQMHLDDIPDAGRPDVQIAMRQSIPKVGYGAPGYLGMSFLEGFREMRDGIGERFEPA